MFSIYADQIVKQEQWANLNRHATHNQLVREALAAHATQQTSLFSTAKSSTLRLSKQCSEWPGYDGNDAWQYIALKITN